MCAASAAGGTRCIVALISGGVLDVFPSEVTAARHTLQPAGVVEDLAHAGPKLVTGHELRVLGLGELQRLGDGWRLLSSATDGVEERSIKGWGHGAAQPRSRHLRKDSSRNSDYETWTLKG